MMKVSDLEVGDKFIEIPTAATKEAQVYVLSNELARVNPDNHMVKLDEHNPVGCDIFTGRRREFPGDHPIIKLRI